MHILNWQMHSETLMLYTDSMSRHSKNTLSHAKIVHTHTQTGDVFDACSKVCLLCCKLLQ